MGRQTAHLSLDACLPGSQESVTAPSEAGPT